MYPLSQHTKKLDKREFKLIKIIFPSGEMGIKTLTRKTHQLCYLSAEQQTKQRGKIKMHLY
jgi:hypothetical protein